MLRNIHQLLYSFWCLECWKWHFRASRFKNFLGGACPQTSYSRLLLFYHLPTSNFIENPASCFILSYYKVLVSLIKCFSLDQAPVCKGLLVVTGTASLLHFLISSSSRTLFSSHKFLALIRNTKVSLARLNYFQSHSQHWLATFLLAEILVL